MPPNFLTSWLPILSAMLRRGESADAALLRRARDGEREAISILVNRHRTRLTNLAFQILRDRESAEDAAQEVLLRALDKLPTFRGESEFSSWLYRLTLNFCLEKRRLDLRRAEILGVHLGEPPTQTASHERQIETRELLECALDALSEPQRIALLLREWQGFSYDEIAEILQLPIGTVRSRLSKARRQFQIAYEAQQSEVLK